MQDKEPEDLTNFQEAMVESKKREEQPGTPNDSANKSYSSIEDVLRIPVGERFETELQQLRASTPPEVLKIVQSDSSSADNPEIDEYEELRELKNNKPTPENTPPGAQRHFTGREGVPQLRNGSPRLRSAIDPNDPDTQPGPIKVTKLPIDPLAKNNE